MRKCIRAYRLMVIILQYSDFANVGKGGNFTSSLAAGQSYTYEVTFNTPFSDRNYTVSLSLNTSNYTYFISEQTSRGFKVYVYANAETSGAEFRWSAMKWISS